MTFRILKQSVTKVVNMTKWKYWLYHVFIFI